MHAKRPAQAQSFTRFAGSVAVIVAMGLPAFWADAARAETQDAAVEEVDEAKLLDRAYSDLEALRKAARLPADMELVIPLYEDLAERGHARSAFRLGNIFYRGTLVEADPERGIAEFRKSAEMGYDPAWRYLANALLAQEQGEEAFLAYEKAAEAGITGSELNVAKAHIRKSFGTYSDPARGLDMLMTLAEDGDATAEIELAKVYADPRSGFVDYTKAREALEDLAASGDAESLIRLAKLYQSGLGVQRSYPKAHEYYVRAIEAGSESAILSAAEMEMRRGQYTEAFERLEKAVADQVEGAEVVLAEAHIRQTLGRQSDNALGAKMIKERVEQGNADFVYLALDLAEDYIRVDVPPQNLIDQTVRLADTGSPTAAAALLSISRERPNFVPGLGAQRRDLLLKYEGILRRSTIVTEEVFLTLDQSPPREAWREVHARLADADTLEYYDTVMASVRGDRNAYVYLLQEELGERGQYSGPSNGLLTGRTLRSILAFCDAGGFGDECLNGPLSGNAARLIAATLATENDKADGDDV